MSRGAVYVKAIDDQWYEDPVIKGDRCHIIFDEDDPPEFVMHTSDVGTANKTLHELCKTHGLQIDRKGKATAGSSRTIDGITTKAVSIFFRLLSRIPVPDNRKPSTMKREGTYFDPLPTYHPSTTNSNGRG